MNTKRIVVTGAPGTGKTSIIKELEGAGFHCFHEVIRSMTAEAKKDGRSDAHFSNPLAFVKDPYQFNRSLLHGRIAQFGEAKKLDVANSFYDRGIPDVLAYMDYFKQEYGDEFIDPCVENQYDLVFVLPPWEEIYISDNERLETYKESEELHANLVHTYSRFGYEPVLVPKSTVEKRMAFILSELNLS